jgi:hypothetical protein
MDSNEDVCVPVEVLQELFEAPEAAFHALYDDFHKGGLLALCLLVDVFNCSAYNFAHGNDERPESQGPDMVAEGLPEGLNDPSLTAGYAIFPILAEIKARDHSCDGHFTERCQKAGHPQESDEMIDRHGLKGAIVRQHNAVDDFVSPVRDVDHAGRSPSPE